MASDTSDSAGEPGLSKTRPNATPSEARPFETDSWWGRIAHGFTITDLESALAQVTDPVSATETIHWGRNYLYRSVLDTEDGSVDVVVKQFRNLGAKKGAERRLKGSKAERSWRMALEFTKAGIPTAEPVLLVESKEPEGPSFFITRHLGAQVEARYIFRAANEGQLEERFPGFDYDLFLQSLGFALRRMHEAGLFHRDLSIGNVLVPEGETTVGIDQITIIDLNRGRKKDRLSLTTRARDLCRLTIYDAEHQRRFVDAYARWGSGQIANQDRDGRASAVLWWTYKIYHHGFRFKIESKKAVRAPFKGVGRGMGQLLAPRRAHVHIPEAPDGASKRDQIVWDYLSDQPHQHAGKLDKLKVRLADAPSHIRNLSICALAAPRIRKRYKELKRELYSKPLPWNGVGICVRPFPEAPEELMAALEDLGVRNVLLRLHPWQSEHDDELQLARELHSKGYDLAYALPQNRDLVRDPKLWEARIEELAELFTPYGKYFQVGQAINRSKWGVWRYGEYIELAQRADQVLRRYPEVETFGPAVIDFELYSTASVVNLASCPSFDGLASLLYVDRRGAPENRQMGFDTVDKVLLCQAIADTSRACAGRSWITEVNWPLWEGPHSPAGKSVSVSEEDQATFLVRYFLLALTSGGAERVYWWQMIARGYGLIAPQDPNGDAAGLRRRSSFQALKTLNSQLNGSTLQGRLSSPPGTYLFDFESSGQRILAGWSYEASREMELEHPVLEAIDQHGLIGEHDQGNRVQLTNTVQFFRI